MVKSFIGSTIVLAALLLMTGGCGLSPAAPSAAAAEAAPPSPRKVVRVEAV